MLLFFFGLRIETCLIMVILLLAPALSVFKSCLIHILIYLLLTPYRRVGFLFPIVSLLLGYCNFVFYTALGFAVFYFKALLS